MSDSKTYIFPETGSAASNNLLASILPALQNKGVDTGYLLGMLNNGNNGGLFGGRGFEDIIALIIVAAIFGNGNFGFGGWGNNGNGGNSAEREMLMSAIQRNGVDLSQLASTLNCSIGQLHSGIDAIAQQICNLSAQNGQNTASIIAALQQGNMALTQQICSCCCDLKQLITTQGYENQIATLNQTNVLQGAINNVANGQERGFSAVAYETQRQTCDLRDNANDNTRAILAKLDSIEDSRKDREIAALTAQVTASNARAERQSELQPIYSALADLKCNQPPVKKICCPENYVPVDSSIRATYGLIPTGCNYGFPFGGFGGFGFNNGNCGGSLWG